MGKNIQEFIRIKRFRDVIVCAELECFNRSLNGRICSHDDDFCVVLLGFYGLQYFEPICSGKAKVGDNNMETLCFQKLQCLQTRFTGRDVVPVKD